MNFSGISKTTNRHKKYWRERKIDWKQAYESTWNHPHRSFIIMILKLFNWLSLYEVGVGGGANMIAINKSFPQAQIGGSDINPDAIENCKKIFKGGLWKVNESENIMLSDKATDVILTDMMLIYVGPWSIKKHLKEFRRVARSSVLFCEFYEKSFFKRLWLHLKTGYYFHDFPKLLKKLGYYDILIFKLPAAAWSGGLQEKYCYLIKAKSPKYYEHN